MTFRLRRVVTGHSGSGKAVVRFDDICESAGSRRPGMSAVVAWTTDCTPADNSGEKDEALREVATGHPNGSVFRIVRYEPGVAPRMHRSNTIDYAVVISGEIDMQLDEEEVHLKAGDVLIQRGTVHNWVNRGTIPCVIAFVLIDAKPYRRGDIALEAVN
jgi:quercetin dioxygenase-like cupin family protein